MEARILGDCGKKDLRTFRDAFMTVVTLIAHHSQSIVFMSHQICIAGATWLCLQRGVKSVETGAFSCRSAWCHVGAPPWNFGRLISSSSSLQNGVVQISLILAHSASCSRDLPIHLPPFSSSVLCGNRMLFRTDFYELFGRARPSRVQKPHKWIPVLTVPTSQL